MDLRTNDFLKCIYTNFLTRVNVILVNRMIRRRVSKLSAGKYRPSETEEHFNYLREKMRDYIRIHIEYLKGTNEEKVALLNSQFADMQSNIMWNEFQDNLVFISNQNREEYTLALPIIVADKGLINPLCEDPIITTLCFENRPNFWDDTPG